MIFAGKGFQAVQSKDFNIASSGASLPSAARPTAVERLVDVRSHPICSYDHFPYERTFSPSYNVRLYL